MRALITGGSGFIGTNLLEYLQGQGADLVNLDIQPPRNPAHRGFWRQVDIRQRDDLISQFQAFKPDIVYHLAARTDLDGPDLAAYSANTLGVENLIEAANTLPELRSVVFASSRLVCRIGYQPRDEQDYCPTTPYGESKVEGERLVRRRCVGSHWGWVILRPTSIWGPWFDVPYKSFFLSVAKGRYVHPAGTQVLKSFGYVGNSVRQLEKTGEAAMGSLRGATLYMADYPPLEVLAFAELIRQASAAPPVRSVPLALLRGLAHLGDTAKALGMKNPPLTRFRLANLMTPMVHDLDRMAALCGPLPIGLNEGVARTVDWLRKQGEIS